MVYKKLLYYIHERLVQIKQNKDEPFGGVSILAVGDFFQLPPVKQKHNERLYKENTTYPFDLWNENFKLVELNEVMRQKEDLVFAQSLNSLRTRTADQNLPNDVLQMLNRCNRDGNDSALHVFATNDEVNQYNLKMVKQIGKDLKEAIAKDFERERTSGKMVLRETPFVRHKSDGIPSSILLCENAKVMIIRNIDVSDGLVNGVIGTVTKIIEDNLDMKSIEVCFQNKSIGVKSGIKTKNGNLVQIRRCEEEMRTLSNKNFVRHQFPIRLAWACTAHKVQGMTTDEIVVDLNKIFSAGQAYVALSRVTSEQGLSISACTEATIKKKIYADKEVSEALMEMPLFLHNDQDLTESSLTIILLNIQSLSKNFAEMTNDSRFKKADIICLTETWLTESVPVNKYDFEDYTLHHVTRKEAYKDTDDLFRMLKASKGDGVAIYNKGYRNISIHRVPVDNIEGMLMKDEQTNVSIIVIYRPNVYPLNKFHQNLDMLLKVLLKMTGQKIIMGDFNENLLSTTKSTPKLMEENGYHQLVTFPTTENGTLIDHVYTNIPLTQLQVLPLPTYFSYHEAITLTLAKDAQLKH